MLNPADTIQAIRQRARAALAKAEADVQYFTGACEALDQLAQQLAEPEKQRSVPLGTGDDEGGVDARPEGPAPADTP